MFLRTDYNTSKVNTSMAYYENWKMHQTAHATELANLVHHRQRFG